MSPTPVRIYTWLRKSDVCPTANELKNTFGLNYSQMYRIMQRAVESRLVNRIFIGGSYYYGASPVSTDPIFYDEALHAPILPRQKTQEELLREQIQELQRKAAEPRSLRERIADWIFETGYRIASFVYPD